MLRQCVWSSERGKWEVLLGSQNGTPAGFSLRREVGQTALFYPVLSTEGKNKFSSGNLGVPECCRKLVSIRSLVELSLYLSVIPYVFAFVIQYFISTEVRAEKYVLGCRILVVTSK